MCLILFRQVTGVMANERSGQGEVPFRSYGRGRDVESGLVAEPASDRPPASTFVEVRPDGQGLQLCEGIQKPRLQIPEAGSAQGHDRLEALVAGRLRPLWPLVHPHGVA